MTLEQFPFLGKYKFSLNIVWPYGPGGLKNRYDDNLLVISKVNGSKSCHGHSLSHIGYFGKSTSSQSLRSSVRNLTWPNRFLFPLQEYAPMTSPIRHTIINIDY